MTHGMQELQLLMQVDPDLSHQYRHKIWPFAPCSVPMCFECDCCEAPGWGPMLTEEVWEQIKPIERKLSIGTGFLCQPCMERRLDRPLASEDLSDVPMNVLHPLYKPSP